MTNTRNQEAMAETIYYLKGIKDEDIKKIPKEIINYLNENASKEYKCDFDYNKPLKELKLLPETRGIIGLICYKYWCTTEEEKRKYIEKIQENEKKHKENIAIKYNKAHLFKSEKNEDDYKNTKQLNIETYKESIFKKIIKRIKNFFVDKK